MTEAPQSAPRTGRSISFLLLLVATIQGLILWWTASQLSATPDETPNMIAGLEYWETGSSMRYNVNPPLVKLWATLPLYFLHGAEPPRLPSNLVDIPQRRYEFKLGKIYIENRGRNAFTDLVLARRMCIWFAVIGTIGVYSLASLWLSEQAALLAAMLWAFNPITLGYGTLFNCDIAAASLGCWAITCGVQALRQPKTSNLVLAGGMLALALLSKFTWLVLLPLVPVVLIAKEFIFRLRSERAAQPASLPRCFRATGALLLVYLVAWLVVLAGYRCEGVFRQLGSYSFVSQILSGPTNTANRFAGSWLASLPMPLPSSMLHGIDQQWEDFDQPRECYLLGQWQRGGWYSYYCLAFLVKLPLGLLLLCFLSIRLLPQYREATWICLPIIVTCFVLVSSKTNMNEHTRYLWLNLPPLIVLAALSLDAGSIRWRILAFVLSGWSIAVGIGSVPCGISYFNETQAFQRGPTDVLAGSNVDWGHGWIMARRWVQNSRTGRPIVVVASPHDVLEQYGFRTSAVCPVGPLEDSQLITLLIGTHERLTLTRENLFPSDGNSFRSLAGCCVEVHEVRWDELAKFPRRSWIVGIAD